MQNFIENEAHTIEGTGPENGWNNDDWLSSWDFHRQGQEDWLEGCLTPGLTTLKTMLTAVTSEIRFDAFGRTDRPLMTLSQALSRMPIYRDRQKRKRPITKFREDDFRDDIEKHNQAWLWAMEELYRSVMLSRAPQLLQVS